MSLRSLALLSAVGILLSVGMIGCPPTTTSKTVLAGTWELTETTSPNPNLTQVLLTFDSSGNLTTVTYVFNNATVTSTGAEVKATTAVSGSTVTITSTFGTNGNNSLDFTGTLNSTDTVITGTSSFSIVISGTTTITFPTGAATLTKQTTVTGNAANGQTLFTSECVGCHSAATVAPGASQLVANTDLGTINAAMAGITLTAQQVADLQAYLATVGTTVTGNATNGQTLFTSECVGCHSAASVAAGASQLVANTDLGTINAAMAGITLTDQQAADLQAYLATQ